MTNAVSAALLDISRQLESRGVSWALVGGFAVSARAEPRFTRGVDVVVAVEDDAQAESLIRSLVGEGGYVIGATVEHEPTGRLATARLMIATWSAFERYLRGWGADPGR